MILRRAEFKRQRWYRRRNRRRSPLVRVLKQVYSDLRGALGPFQTPFLASLKPATDALPVRWGGKGLGGCEYYFDVLPVRLDDYAGHRSNTAVPVHSGDGGQGPSTDAA